MVIKVIKTLIDLAVPLVNVWSKVATMTTLSILDKFERKVSRLGAVRTGKRSTLFISSEDMDEIIKIVKLVEDADLLIDGATETVKY